MQIGVFAKTFPGSDPATVLAAAAAAGFDGVQYNMSCSGLAPMPAEIPLAAATAVATAARHTGQRLFALSGTYNMAHPDAAVRRDGLSRLEVLAAACRGLGTNLVTLCTGTRDPLDQWRHHPDNASREAWRDTCDSLAAAAQIAERHGIGLGVEPELANVVNSAGAARRLIDDIGSPAIGIVLDPANLFEVADAAERRRHVQEAVDLLGDRIVMAHAKDRLADGSFAAAGAGVIDFGHVFKTLYAAGFSGPVVTHGLTAGEASEVASFLRRQIEALPG